jgi:O-methyltransferase involved in polyketide biosynthesis
MTRSGNGAPILRERLNPGLTGTPETALATLWGRAMYATDASPILKDPVAVDLIERIDYDFHHKFGNANSPGNLSFAIRSHWSDERIRRFLVDSPGGPVVALGEGLETQLWRVDNNEVCWYSLDLPEAIALRQKLLPPHKRNTLLAGSVLDPTCLSATSPCKSVFITAAGLLMYLQSEEVRTLLRQVVQRFTHGHLVFDTIPHWFSRKTKRGFNPSGRYAYPPMPFALALREVPDFLAEVTPLKCFEASTFADAYPHPTSLFARIPWVRKRWAHGLVHATW